PPDARSPAGHRAQLHRRTPGAALRTRILGAGAAGRRSRGDCAMTAVVLTVAGLLGVVLALITLPGTIELALLTVAGMMPGGAFAKNWRAALRAAVAHVISDDASGPRSRATTAARSGALQRAEARWSGTVQQERQCLQHGAAGLAVVVPAHDEEGT